MTSTPVLRLAGSPAGIRLTLAKDITLCDEEGRETLAGPPARQDIDSGHWRWPLQIWSLCAACHAGRRGYGDRPDQDPGGR
jgi:hypothetical protein